MNEVHFGTENAATVGFADARTVNCPEGIR
jgi:hypothetical protein